MLLDIARENYRVEFLNHRSHLVMQDSRHKAGATVSVHHSNRTHADRRATHLFRVRVQKVLHRHFDEVSFLKFLELPVHRLHQGDEIWKSVTASAQNYHSEADLRKVSVDGEFPGPS